jgi:hypothetical protein
MACDGYGVRNRTRGLGSFDPATGRFLTRDPIGLEGGINLYATVGNGVVMGSDPAGLHNNDKCFEAIREARELADKIEEHLQKIRDNLPSMAGLCIPNELCAALPRRPDDKTLFEKWEEYRGHVRDVEGLKRTLEEEPRKIDNNCNNHWKNYFGAEIKYFQSVLIAPVPEGSGGVFPCIPLPDMGVPRVPLPRPVPIRPPMIVPVSLR